PPSRRPARKVDGAALRRKPAGVRVPPHRLRASTPGIHRALGQPARRHGHRRPVPRGRADGESTTGIRHAGAPRVPDLVGGDRPFAHAGLRRRGDDAQRGGRPRCGQPGGHRVRRGDGRRALSAGIRADLHGALFPRLPPGRPRIAGDFGPHRDAARRRVPPSRRAPAWLFGAPRRRRPRLPGDGHRGLVRRVNARGRFALWLLGACALVLLLAIWSFSVGRFPVSAAEVWRALWAALTGSESGLAANAQAVVTNVRAPRVAAALSVGAALAAAGASYQNLFKNPLVSPDILGVAAGCALGAGLAILLSLPIGAIHAFAFVGGLAAVGLVIAIGTWVGGRDPLLTLILTGVVVGSLF